MASVKAVISCQSAHQSILQASWRNVPAFLLQAIGRELSVRGNR
jgi:hypothetical protein